MLESKLALAGVARGVKEKKMDYIFSLSRCSASQLQTDKLLTLYHSVFLFKNKRMNYTGKVRIKEELKERKKER